eukprot:8241961-Heterocapsa_arctica.AAC.1
MRISLLRLMRISAGIRVRSSPTRDSSFMSSIRCSINSLGAFLREGHCKDQSSSRNPSSKRYSSRLAAVAN